MNEAQDHKMAGLAGLAIDRHQRPTSSGRGWIMLAGIAGVVLVIAAGATWWYYRTTGRNIVAAMTTPPAEVSLLTVDTIQDASQQTVLVANGKIVSDRQIKVATKVSGQIVQLHVEQGDTVQAGQVLARVEDTVHRALRDEVAANVSRRNHEIVKARAEHERARATVLRAQANLAFDQRNYDRLQPLRQRGQVDDWEFDNARNKYEASSAALEEARAAEQSAAAAVDIARSELKAAEAYLARTQKRLDDCTIVAPIAGVVLERNAQVGDFLAAEGGRGANANAQLVEIADTTRMRVEIDVSERDIHRLQADQTARITPDADRATAYRGQIMWVDPVGDYARAIVQVKVRIFEPGPDLRVGGSAKVEFHSPAPDAVAGDERRPANWLPKSAVKLTPGSEEATVFTVIEGRASAQAVTIGARTEDRVEVRSGVYPGMQIIAEDLDDIEDGTTVKVVGSRQDADQ